MHLLAEKSVHIRRHARTVFEYVSNIEKLGEWFPGVIAIESLNTLGHGQQGKTYLETVSVPLRGIRKITLEVREVRGHQFFAMEGRFSPLLPRTEIALADTGPDSCELTWRMFSRSKHLVARYTVLPLASRVMDKRGAVGLAALKKRMEGEEVAPSPDGRIT